jgi:hypothetical protein
MDKEGIAKLHGSEKSMINASSLKAVKEGHFDTELCRPLYHSYCFSRIPATLRAYFAGPGRSGKDDEALPTDVGGFDAAKDFVVLFFVDGFGYRFFEQYQENAPFLQRFIKEGTVSKLTSQFPSTTAAHVACLNTGLEVGQHGMYEWFYYEPVLKKMIAPLLCSFAGDKAPGTLEKAGIPIDGLYPTRTLYDDLQQSGVHSFVLQSASIAHSPYTRAMFRGASYLPYHSFADALDSVVDLYQSKPPGEKWYVYVYFSDLDAVGHRSGPSSPEYAKETMQFLGLMEQRFFRCLKVKGDKKGACVVTADHGMVEISPQETLYLNREIPAFERLIAKNPEGKLLVPAGSCRDFFLHIQPEALKEAKGILENWLGERAWIVTAEELIARGFFGMLPPSELFLSRVGNLVILPRQNHSVWWYEKGRFEQHFYGMHGGLSCAEMEIPFLFHEL